MGASTLQLSIVAWSVTCLRGVSGYGSGANSPLIQQQPSSVNNPFVADPSADQLPLWALANPFGGKKRTTNSAGNPLPSNTASLGIGSRGPLLLDAHLLDRLQSFVRERIPERVVHANGLGAFGHFVVTHDVSRYTRAKFLNGIGKVTKVAVRFSSIVRTTGTAETAPDGRGFAVRFYTEDGNHDLVGLLSDIFTIRDPMLFPSIMHATKANPQTHVPSPDMNLDFISLRPETIHSFVKFRSDNGRPGSMRGINGSAITAFKCVNAKAKPVWCKFSWRTHQYIPNLSDAETVTLAGTEPNYYTKDLYNAIGQKNFPKWTLGMQVMTYEQAESLPFNAFDSTKLWRHEDFPFIPIGIIVLDTNPTDFFTQIEQLAFCPGNMVPGIEVSPDRLLAARVIVYKDAHRHRIGPNFNEIEVNRPISAVDTYDRDGSMRLGPDDNGNGGPVYFPNSFNGPRLDPNAREHTYSVSGVAGRFDTGGDDNFSQVRQFLEVGVSPEERERIAFRIATSLAAGSPGVQNRMLVNALYPISKDFGDRIATLLQNMTNDSDASPGYVG